MMARMNTDMDSLKITPKSPKIPLHRQPETEDLKAKDEEQVNVHLIAYLAALTGGGISTKKTQWSPRRVGLKFDLGTWAHVAKTDGSLILRLNERNQAIIEVKPVRWVACKAKLEGQEMLQTDAVHVDPEFGLTDEMAPL